MSRLVERSHLEGKNQIGADPLERCRPQLRVAIFELGVQAVPESADKAVKQVQTLLQTSESLCAQQGVREPCGNLKVFSLAGKGLNGQL